MGRDTLLDLVGTFVMSPARLAIAGCLAEGKAERLLEHANEWLTNAKVEPMSPEAFSQEMSALVKAGVVQRKRSSLELTPAGAHAVDVALHGLTGTARQAADEATSSTP